ncbi:MAG: HK97 family phage prohead protease [Thermomicrobiales bacterium]
MAQPTIEYRDVAEVKPRADGATDGFEGYAATFMRADSYGTAFAPKAFKRSLSQRRDRIPLLYQHNPDWAIGAPTVLREDDTGLYHDSTVIDDGAEGSVALKRLRGGVPFGMSFGFQTLKDRSSTGSDSIDVTQTPGFEPADVRVITEVKLWEISLVTFPANEAATITSVRSEIEIDALASVLEELRAGTLTEGRRALLREIVAAWQDAPGPESIATPPTASAARRDRDRQIAIVMATTRWGHLLKDVA